MITREHLRDMRADLAAPAVAVAFTVAALTAFYWAPMLAEWLR